MRKKENEIRIKKLYVPDPPLVSDLKPETITKLKHKINIKMKSLILIEQCFFFLLGFHRIFEYNNKCKY